MYSSVFSRNGGFPVKTNYFLVLKLDVHAAKHVCFVHCALSLILKCFVSLRICSYFVAL